MFCDVFRLLKSPRSIGAAVSAEPSLARSAIGSFGWREQLPRIRKISRGRLSLRVAVVWRDLVFALIAHSRRKKTSAQEHFRCVSDALHLLHISIKLFVSRGRCPPTFQTSLPHVTNERRIASVFPVTATKQFAIGNNGEVPILPLQRFNRFLVRRSFGLLHLN